MDLKGRVEALAQPSYRAFAEYTRFGRPVRLPKTRLLVP